MEAGVPRLPGPVVRTPHDHPARRRLHRSRWPVAAAEVALAVVASEILPRLEHEHGWHGGFEYDPGTAQATLGAIAGGMITLTGFVLTAVTLIVQTVQAQSPRLLRILDRTDGTPLLYGTFTATFTFALAVLAQVHPDSVPSLSVSLALLLVLACTALFLRLLVTFRTTLTVGGLTRTVGAQLRELIDVLYPAAFGSGYSGRHAPLDAGQPSWAVRYDGQPGVLQAFDERAAVRLATATGTDIRFIPAVGDFLVTGSPLAAGGGQEPGQAAIARLVRVGSFRTLEQDPAYGIRLLVDIAIRALSPAVNDPTSAVQALDQLDDILRRLVTRSLGDGLLADANGRVVVTFPAPRWEAFLSLAVDEITLYGAGAIQVTRRLLALLTDLHDSAPERRRPPIEARIATLRRVARRSLPDERLAAEAVRPDRQGIGSPRRDDRARPPDDTPAGDDAAAQPP